jgi:hypothetical protein
MNIPQQDNQADPTETQNADSHRFYFSKQGRAVAVICLPDKPCDFFRFLGDELQGCILKLSGALLPIHEESARPDGIPFISVGGAGLGGALPETADFGAEEFILRTVVDASRAEAVVCLGGGEAGTMYAVYELLERLGVVFQLTNDIFPEVKPDLSVPELSVRMEPHLELRGMHCCHGIRWHMGLDDFRRHLDQMAKLKLNCLQFYFGIGGSPWLEFSYKGRKTEITYPKESGYLAWSGEDTISVSGTVADVRVGRECFPGEYLGAPEFAGVEKAADAYGVAREFLREVIRHAHSRKIQVLLGLGEIPYLPESLVPPEDTDQKFKWYCGSMVDAEHPDIVPIWGAAVDALVESYPEADGIFFWSAESTGTAGDTEGLLTSFRARHPGVRELIPTLEAIERLGNKTNVNYPTIRALGEKTLDHDFIEICTASQVIVEARKRHPGLRLCYVSLFKEYLMRALDALMPKDVLLQGMVTFANSAPVMHFFKGIEDRKLVVMPRIDHDGCDLHMQLNLTQYEEDEIISESAGLFGIVGQLNKERGLEINARFVAEGAWRPGIGAAEFYRDYLGRLYGPQSSGTLAEAFILLDRQLGYRELGNGEIMLGYRHFHLYPLNPSKDKQSRGERVPEILALAQLLQRRSEFWRSRVEKGREALGRILAVPSHHVPSGSRKELEYVAFKVSSFNTHMETAAELASAQSAMLRTEAACLNGDRKDYPQNLDACDQAHRKAEALAHQCARQMIPFCEDPTERFLLFRYNQNVIGSIEVDRAYLDRLFSMSIDDAFDMIGRKDVITEEEWNRYVIE